MNYIGIIKQAIIFFPIIAIIITTPFVLIQYHRYGSISFLKTLIIYSFVLYLLCAYFLVILPLPSKESVANLTISRTQLIPFMFVNDFIKSFSFNFDVLTKNCFYMPFFNIVLTIPFGIYLRYLFKIDLKKCVLYSFLLSLFFELTQLTGLYFIYSRGYRLFDVDDLLLNTLGGIIGYALGSLILKPLPTIDEVNDDALANGIRVSGLKRTTCILIDLFILVVISTIACFVIDNKYTLLICIMIYYLAIPLFSKGSTLGQLFLHLRITNRNKEFSFFRLLIRLVSFVLIYIVIPFALLYICINAYSLIDNKNIVIFICLLLGLLLLLFYVITAFKYLFTGKPLLYERISKTILISTIMNKKELTLP